MRALRPYYALRAEWAARRDARQRAVGVQGTHRTVEGIRDGVLTASGGRHRALLDVQGKAWPRLTEAAQDQLLDHHAWLCFGLGHPLQWLATSRPDTLEPQAARLDAVRNEQNGQWPPALHETSAALATYLRGLGAARALRRRRVLLVVPTDERERAAALAQLGTRTHDLAGALGRIGLRAARLDTDGIVAALRASWYATDETVLTPDDAAPAGVDAERDALYVDHGDGTGHWLRGWRLTRWPEQLTGAWLLPLVTSGVISDVALHVTPLDTREYQAELRTRTRRHGTAVAWLSRHGWPLWDGLARAHKQAAELADALEGGGQRAALCSVTVLVRAPTRAVLEDRTERAERELRAAGGRWLRCRREHHLALRTCRPEGVDALGAPLEADTATLAHLLPALTGRLGHGAGDRALLYGFDGDQPLLVDPFDARADAGAERNATAILVAPPGAGKSVRAKLEAAWSLLAGGRAAVFDVEGEYDPLLRLFGPLARDVVPGQEGSQVNPLALAVEDAADANPVRRQIQSVLALFEVALAARKGGLSDEQTDVLDAALVETYTRAGIAADRPETWSRPAPSLDDLAAVLAATPGAVAQGLRRGLLRYTTGSLAGLFGPTTRLTLEAPFVRFDLRRVERAQRPLAVYVCLLALWRDQLARPVERLVYVDEAWQFFALPHAAEQLETVALRGRKWRLGPRFVFHNAAQFAASPAADQVRQSAAVQVVLGQTEQSIDGVAGLWHLSERDRADLLTAAKGAGLVFTGGGHAFAELDLTGWPLLPYLLTGVQAG